MQTFGSWIWNESKREDDNGSAVLGSREAMCGPSMNRLDRSDFLRDAKYYGIAALKEASGVAPELKTVDPAQWENNMVVSAALLATFIGHRENWDTSELTVPRILSELGIEGTIAADEFMVFCEADKPKGYRPVSVSIAIACARGVLGRSSHRPPDQWDRQVVDIVTLALSRVIPDWSDVFTKGLNSERRRVRRAYVYYAVLVFGIVGLLLVL